MQAGTDAHLKQRAMFLYRLMSTDLAKAQEFALSGHGQFSEFFEDKNDEVRERLFQEFNSLSVVYQKPSERFLKETELKQSLASEKKYFPERRRGRKRRADGAPAEGDEEQDDVDQSTNLLGESATTAASSAPNQSVEDLIGLGAPTQAASQPATAEDLLGLGAPV